MGLREGLILHEIYANVQAIVPDMASVLEHVV